MSVCQQCKTPLQLDASLVDLAPSQYDMLLHSLPPAPAPARPALDALPGPPALKAAWAAGAHEPPARRTASPRAPAPAESFVLLQESAIRGMPPAPPSSTPTPPTSPARRRREEPTVSAAPAQEPQSLSHRLRSTARLLGTLSARTDAEHPLCSDCTATLLNSLQRALDEAKRERDGYAAFEREVRREREREGAGDPAALDARIGELRAEERQAVDAVRAAEAERGALQAELAALEADERALAADEDAFWRAHTAGAQARAAAQSQLSALRAAHAADAAALARLERANVYNDAFCIGHDGPFGTVNGLRLGRVPGVPVEWAEVNAAWGQTLLLLHTVARKLEFAFEGYKLVPMGSHSRIERTSGTGDRATYELYGSGDLHLGRLLHNRRFDFAMVAFLDCLRQITDWARAQDPALEFPHAIAKDRIGESSIKLQFSQEEAWTRALRHVLLALKILLKWTTNGSNG